MKKVRKVRKANQKIKNQNLQNQNPQKQNPQNQNQMKLHQLIQKIPKNQKKQINKKI